MNGKSVSFEGKVKIEIADIPHHSGALKGEHSHYSLWIHSREIEGVDGIMHAHIDDWDAKEIIADIERMNKIKEDET